jgi:Domain of unknown function (DUF1987).
MYPDSFKNNPTKRTPWIIFIMGRSIPENPGDFFRPIREWVSEYAKNNIEKSKIELGFEYINTSSTKWIFTILKELSEMKEIVKNASVTWYYERGDEDMCELGFILRSLFECPFIVVEVDEMNRARYEKILAMPD